MRAPWYGGWLFSLRRLKLRWDGGDTSPAPGNTGTKNHGEVWLLGCLISVYHPPHMQWLLMNVGEDQSNATHSFPPRWVYWRSHEEAGQGCTGGVGGGAALLSAVGEKSSLDNALRWRGAINLCVNTEYWGHTTPASSSYSSCQSSWSIWGNVF